MTPRGERRHFITKACSTALGCQQSRSFFGFRLRIESLIYDFIFEFIKLFMHLHQYVRVTGTTTGHVLNVAKVIDATNTFS